MPIASGSNATVERTSLTGAALRSVVIAAALWMSITVAHRPAGADEKVPSGDSTIRAKAGSSEIVITTTSRLAGAIHSLTWDGVEFIDSTDHGRQLQSASNFDAGSPFTPETFNPTEAGSVHDGAGQTSTSRLLHLIAKGHELQTTTQMAFWLPPGGKSQGHPAKNTTTLSNHLLTKRVRIGYKHLPQVIQYDVTFQLPIGEHHRYAQLEAVTGYLPARFETFWKFNRSSGELEPLDDGPGEQAWPVVLATPDGRHAMGVFSPDQPSRGYESVGYGRFRFKEANVVKWNSVFRVRELDLAAKQDYSYTNFIAVGDLATVKQSLRELHHQFIAPGQPDLLETKAK